jgi:hypothetical protein
MWGPGVAGRGDGAGLVGSCQRGDGAKSPPWTLVGAGGIEASRVTTCAWSACSCRW